MKYLIFAICAALFLAGCTPDYLDDCEVIIGKKPFTEQRILAHIAAQLLAANGIAAGCTVEFANTFVVRDALESGEIDMYWEYTGTAWISIMLQEYIAGTSSLQMFEQVRDKDAENGIVWLDFAPLNNTFALAMQPSRAQELGIATLSDLGAFTQSNPGELSFSSIISFAGRPDGLMGLAEVYGMNFGENITHMAEHLQYLALSAGLKDVIVVYSTDGRIMHHDFVLLEDDRNFFPPYNPAPNISAQLLERFPQLPEIFNPISALLTNEVMQYLNHRVDNGGYTPQEVAEYWLHSVFGE